MFNLQQYITYKYMVESTHLYINQNSYFLREFTLYDGSSWEWDHVVPYYQHVFLHKGSVFHNAV